MVSLNYFLIRANIYLILHKIRMKLILSLIFLLSVAFANQVAYPVRCQEIGDSVIGAVTDCDVTSDPLPFTWSTIIKLKKTCKWAGIDDVSYIYSNPDQTIEGTCTTGTTLPGSYSKNDNITIQQTCRSFSPPLEKGATLLVLVFYTHHETFDDVLMYNFPIPGYINNKEEVRVLTK